MKIRQFIPLAVVIVAALCVFARKTNVPVAPIGTIATIGCTLLLLQLEDRKLGDMVAEFFRMFRSEHHA